VHDGCHGQVSTRSIRIRATVLLTLSVASLGLIIAKGLGPRQADGGRANAADVVFRRDALAQKRDAAALLPRLDDAGGLRQVRMLLAAESGSAAPNAGNGARSSADASVAVRRHFQGDIVLAHIEVAAGANPGELADARLLLEHGRRGIAELRPT